MKYEKAKNLRQKTAPRRQKNLWQTDKAKAFRRTAKSCENFFTEINPDNRPARVNNNFADARNNKI